MLTLLVLNATSRLDSVLCPDWIKAYVIFRAFYGCLNSPRLLSNTIATSLAETVPAFVLISLVKPPGTFRRLHRPRIAVHLTAKRSRHCAGYSYLNTLQLCLESSRRAARVAPCKNARAKSHRVQPCTGLGQVGGAGRFASVMFANSWEAGGPVTVSGHCAFGLSWSAGCMS